MLIDSKKSQIVAISLKKYIAVDQHLNYVVSTYINHAQAFSSGFLEKEENLKNI